MKKNLLKVFVILGIALGFLLIGNSVKAGSIRLNSLDFQIQLNEDGSMDVTENWDAKIRDTNTMFKDIHMDSTKFKQITNVEVYRIGNNGTKTKLTKINQEMYHVTKDCYYGMVVSSGDFEIAWGVSVDNTETRKYQVKYKVIDAVKTYADCSELYWQLVGDENGIPADKVTATIKLPKAVQNRNNLRGWAHGPYNGNITVGTSSITIDLDYLSAETMVEVRIATTEDLFSKNAVINKKRLNTILSEEQHWADEANEERNQYIKEKRRQEELEKIWDIAKIVLSIVLSIFLIFILIRNSIKVSKIPKKKKPLIEYFRDMPDKNASAGDAAFLYYFKNGNFLANLSKVLSATMLQLALKKYIAFSEDKTERKPQIRVNILDYSDHMDQMPPLKKDEQIVYELLTKVANSKAVKEKSPNGNTFTMKEFENYAKKHSATFTNNINKIEGVVKNEQEKLGNYDKNVITQASNTTGYIVLDFVLGALLIAFLPIPAILLFINTIPHFVMHSKVYTLTDKGIEEAAKWKGLKKYMEDFSLLNEKEVPDLKLWEKYLVYATAFGIADKVLQQLKVKYPNLQEMEGYGYDYAYMHLLYHSTLNTAFLSSFNTAVNKAYMGGINAQAASSYDGGNFSSGGGFGGGFSGGGGFGGGGGRNGRKIRLFKSKVFMRK